VKYELTVEERIAMSSRSKGIVVYLALAFVGAWGIWGVAWLFGALNTGISGQVIVAVGAFSPALAAIAVRAWVTRERFADAGLRPHLRRMWPYYLVSWLLPLPVVAAIMLLAAALGISQVNGGGAGLPPLLVTEALVGTLVSAPLFWGEEFGWRSYLQLRLASGRPALAAVLTGLAWGIFHYPLILIGYEGYENAALGLAIFPVFTILMSIILGWLRLKTGSVWVTCLGHAAANGLGGTLTSYLYLGGGHFVFASYAGILSWAPLGALCAGILLFGGLRSPGRGVEHAALTPAHDAAMSR
jgi:membrane protease YdiL (CAAX protease family)